MTGGPRGDYPAAPEPRDCASLILKPTLSSPVPEVLSKLRKGQTLDVRLQGQKGPVFVETSDGETAGTVTGTALARLINCIREGFVFIAIVVSINGGQCIVEIRPRSA